jgi:MFS transporter, SP family, arabinose:H+ symporter
VQAVRNDSAGVCLAGGRDLIKSNNSTLETYPQDSRASREFRAQGGALYLSFVCCVSALGGVLFGFDTAVISGALTALKKQFTLGTVMEGWLVSSALLGCALGAIAAGWVADRFGRKLVLLVSGSLFVACSIGCALAWSLNVLIWARFVGGLGVGLASMVSPLYISEISPTHVRGRMVTLFQFAITIGICLALFSNAGLQHLASIGSADNSGGFYRWVVVDQTWRAMFHQFFLPACAWLCPKRLDG